jgi:hypothetical protein
MTAAEEAASAALLDLDALERDDPSRNKPPFAFLFHGRRIELTDPVEIDWQVLIEMAQSPGTFATAAMKPDDRKFFESYEVPTWKLDKLIDRYQSYYDIDTSSGKLKG